MNLAVESIKLCLKRQSDLSVAWIAYDGAQAVQKCAEDKPDLVLMDLLMPVMNGVEATRQIMLKTPCPIIVVTAGVSEKMPLVYEAMSFGALDVVNTPSPSDESAQALLNKIAVVQKLVKAPANSPSQFTFKNPVQNCGPFPFLVAIGASTGGPQALSEILSQIDADAEAAFVIIQHVDEQFAKGLATWLGEKCQLPIILAEEGALPQPGRIYIAATNNHLVIEADRSFHYTPEPAACPYRPSVDAFFLSLERNWAEKGIAVLLTGMGKDGAAGLLALRKKGWHTIAQDEATSLIYAMPKAAAALNAAKEILPINAIARAIKILSGKIG